MTVLVPQKHLSRLERPTKHGVEKPLKLFVVLLTRVKDNPRKRPIRSSRINIDPFACFR